MTGQRWGEVKSILAAVLDAPLTDRPALLDRLCGPDTDLRASVNSLVALEAQAANFLVTEFVPGAALRAEPKAPEQIGPWRIVGEVGHGGMGVVYLGERADGEFRKQAAIKLITSGLRDLDLQRRFRRERQILATLEHSGIARLLDGGATPDGQPYFVMEFVEGKPLLEYCRLAAATVEDRLRLFLQVCDAVEYAHQRLIVHRDLKPGNILVTSQGVPKLLDFGLARVLDAPPDEDLTQTGVPLMTPAYASPEQVRGEPYTVSGDVYSLGVVLYELLAGRRPYEVKSSSLVELATAICEHEPPPLSAAEIPWRRRLAGDLDNIVAKAMAKQVADRYSTVAEFAGDIRRHLDGRPVRAHAATWRYRFIKWLRRHRIAAPAGALAALLILGFAGATWWEARRAERRFAQVQSLARSVLFELHDAIRTLPGSTAARALLLQRAIQYLESLNREAGGRADLQREVAVGYLRIGEVQGSVGDSNLGNVPAAITHFEKGEAILARLLARSPNDKGLLHDHNRAANFLVGAYVSAARFPAALALAQRTAARADLALQADPGDVRKLADAISSLSAWSDVLTSMQSYPEATPIRERVERLAARYAALLPQSAEAARTLAISKKKLAALYGMAKRYDEAQARYQEAAVIDERRLSRDPNDIRAKLDLSFDYGDLGWVAGRLGKFEDSLTAYRRVYALRAEAARADPRDQRAATSLAAAGGRVGIALRRVGDLEGSERELRKSIAAYRDLVRTGRTGWETSRNLAMMHDELAGTLGDGCEKTHGGAACRSRVLAELNAEWDLLQDLHTRGVLSKADDAYLADLARRKLYVP